jgi:hypothetical protein
MIRFKYFKKYYFRSLKGYKKYMGEIVFKDNSIQKGHRIKIPKAIVDTLNLKEGEKIKIRFDVDKKKMLIEVDDES